MMNNSIKVSFLLGLMVVCTSVSAQEKSMVTVTLTNTSFDKAIQILEEQTSYKFFYDRAITDSLMISVQSYGQPIEIIVQKMLSETGLQFSIYNQFVFITKDHPVVTEFPIFQETRNADQHATDLRYLELVEEDVKRKQMEDKLYTIGVAGSSFLSNATLSGFIRDVKNGESIVGASVYIENTLTGVASDQFGHYSIKLPKGKQTIIVKSIGMKTTTRKIMLNGDGKLDIELSEDITPLKEVVIESERDQHISGVQMGIEKLDIKAMKNMPLALGETDVLKVVLSLPGVQSAGEGSNGLNIRGGATNQNLILYNDAVVYNPSHLFGFFSTFNPDVLKNIELYKSGITADYGGRLSSVLDIHTREGNLKKLSGFGGISPITGRISLEGPIIKDQTSFLFGFRSTYSNWILRQLNSQALKNSEAAFYDINVNVNHQVNDNNSLTLSAYMSKDGFKLASDTTYAYSDRNASLKWRHTFSQKLFSVFTGSISRYNYSVNSESNPVEAAELNFSVGQWNLKTDFSFFPSTKHATTFGASITKHALLPGNYDPIGELSEIIPVQIKQEQGIESALYIGDQFEITPKISLYGGLRYSHFKKIGSGDVFLYANGAAKSESTIVDTLSFNKGETIVTYQGFEPRFSMRYLFPKNTSLKISYNRMRQYIQMLSNTTAIAPTDIWKLSDYHLEPQIGDQISIGFYSNLRRNTLETSVEVYYKDIKNAIDFVDGAILLLNPHLETDVLNAKGKAYGVEFLIKKNTGRLNGWISYTYSRSLLQIKGKYKSETVNNGKYYPSSYDKPHAVNFISNYKVSRRFNFSFNVTYSTGRPITEPIAQYEIRGSRRILYEDRNASRIPDYFRCDISVNMEGNHKTRKFIHGSWTLAVYNLTGRANAYSVYFASEQGKINGYQLSIFAQPIPTLTYNFKF